MIIFILDISKTKEKELYNYTNSHLVQIKLTVVRVCVYLIPIVHPILVIKTSCYVEQEIQITEGATHFEGNISLFCELKSGWTYPTPT